MSSQKEDFIEAYSNAMIDNAPSLSKRAKKHFTLRNVLVALLLLVSLLLILGYAYASVINREYAPTYDNLIKVLENISITGTEQNQVLSTMNDSRMVWTRLYKEYASYLVGGSTLSAILAIFLWGFCPNFTFTELVKGVGKQLRRLWDIIKKVGKHESK